jgi:hypothetical protein
MRSIAGNLYYRPLAATESRNSPSDADEEAPRVAIFLGDNELGFRFEGARFESPQLLQVVRASDSSLRTGLPGADVALYVEAGLFALIPLCAAAMARGYGMRARPRVGC